TPSGVRGISLSIYLRNKADLAYECGFRPKLLRELVCRTLRTRADSDNWSEYPNIDNEVRNLIDDCPWYFVYDIIESILAQMQQAPYSYDGSKFSAELNLYFVSRGIGWKITEGRVEMRGPAEFENLLKATESFMESKNFPTAANEPKEAIWDLSRRPEPDVTGAIQHSLAALECVARSVCGDGKANLGDIMKRYRGIVPSPLDEAVSKIWGYASENGRHVREGRVPTFEESELVVTLVSGISTYLLRKNTA
ncbi:AbiJ-NTD4 domain-containing protein, partial [Caldimonas tepidiphila]|uniref:AbiJ-NTD4 domain-containing protein n=1 Tax=Caldimonas tepidiphila TaxID=2315841 RepID=UPI0014738D8A